METLVKDFQARDPPLEPLDIWVWEVAAARGMLGKTVCVNKPLIDRAAMASVKEQQDDQNFLNKVYAERGYGK